MMMFKYLICIQMIGIIYGESNPIQVSYSDLLTEQSMSIIRTGLGVDGFIKVTNVPGLESSVQRFQETTSECTEYASVNSKNGFFHTIEEYDECLAPVLDAITLRRATYNVVSTFVQVLSSICGVDQIKSDTNILTEFTNGWSVEEMFTPRHDSNRIIPALSGDLGMFQAYIEAEDPSSVSIRLGNTLDGELWKTCPLFATPKPAPIRLVYNRVVNFKATSVESRGLVETEDHRSLMTAVASCTAMYMTGFVWTDSIAPCLLFPGWALNNTVKLVFGCIGVFLFGVLIEGVISFRGYTKKHPFSETKWMNFFIYISLYTVQVVFGYFAMLVAMTYSGPLFLSLVLGLALGHTAFHWRDIFSKAPRRDTCKHANDPAAMNFGDGAMTVADSDDVEGGNCCQNSNLKQLDVSPLSSHSSASDDIKACC